MSKSAAPNEDATTGLQKHMTISNCISYLISMIIGSGIFIVPNVSSLKIIQFFQLYSQIFYFWILGNSTWCWLSWNGFSHLDFWRNILNFWCHIIRWARLLNTQDWWWIHLLEDGISKCFWFSFRLVLHFYLQSSCWSFRCSIIQWLRFEVVFSKLWLT